MKKIHRLIFLLLLTLMATLLLPKNTLATEWLYPFVVWDGYTYEVTDENVSKVDAYIGEVTKHSDMDTYPGNFSNAYRKGTNYYSIQGISTNEAIAVEVKKNNFKKALKRGAYSDGGNKEGYFSFTNMAITVFVALLLILLISLTITYIYPESVME